jgi:hypothetical protein
MVFESFCRFTMVFESFTHYLNGSWTVTCIESQLDRNVDLLNKTSTTT